MEKKVFDWWEPAAAYDDDLTTKQQQAPRQCKIIKEIPFRHQILASTTAAPH